MFKLKYIWILLACIIFMQCGKKCEHKEFFLDGEIKYANQFINNSYWVYQDSITALLDSVVTYGVDLRIIDMSNPSGTSQGNLACKEYVEVSELFYGIKVQNSNGVYESYPITNPNGAGYAYVQADRDGLEGENLSGIFFNCYTSFTMKDGIIGEVKNSEGLGWSKLLAFYPSYNLNGTDYTNVYHMESKKVETYQGTDSTYVNIMYSTHSGVIKMRYQKNGEALKVKELIRSNIVK